MMQAVIERLADVFAAEPENVAKAAVWLVLLYTLTLIPLLSWTFSTLLRRSNSAAQVRLLFVLHSWFGVMQQLLAGQRTVQHTFRCNETCFLLLADAFSPDVCRSASLPATATLSCPRQSRRPCSSVIAEAFSLRTCLGRLLTGTRLLCIHMAVFV